MIKVMQLVQYAVLFTVVLALVGCGVPKSEHQMLEQKYDKIQKEMSDFNEQAKKVQLENAFLKKQVKELEDHVNRLKEENEVIKAQYQKKVTEEKQTITTTQ